MKLNYSAIFMGWLIAHVGQIAFDKSLVRIFMRSAAKGVTDEAQLLQIAEKLFFSVPPHLAQLVAQTIVIFFAVYVALQIAEVALFAHAMVLGVLIVTSTLIFWLGYWTLWPSWYSMLSLLLPIPTALLAEQFSSYRLNKPQKQYSSPTSPPIGEKPQAEVKERPKW